MCQRPPQGDLMATKSDAKPHITFVLLHLDALAADSAKLFGRACSGGHFASHSAMLSVH